MSVRKVQLPCELKDFDGKTVLSTHLASAGEYKDELNTVIITFTDGTVLKVASWVEGHEVEGSGVLVEVNGTSIVAEREQR